MFRWSATLSAVADDMIYVSGGPVAPDSGTELSSTDVDAQWFRENAYEEPLPSRPLSATTLWLGTAIEPGTSTAEFAVPTVTDGEREETEYLPLRFTTRPASNEESVVGVVTDQP